MYLLNKRTKAQIIDRITSRISKAPGFEGYGPQSKQLNTIFEIVSDEIADVYQALDVAVDMNLISRSFGFYLDLIAPNGLERNVVNYDEITCEDKNVALSVSTGVLYDYLNLGSDKPFATIPPGVRLETSNPSLVVITNEHTSFGPYDSVVYLGVSVEMDYIDDASGVANLPPGVITGISISDIKDRTGQAELFNVSESDKFSVTNTLSFSVGSDVESDESFKLRMSEYHTASATGNESAVRNIALSYPDVKDVQFRRFSQGTGSFDVILIPTKDTVSRVTIANINQQLASVVTEGQRYRVVEPGYVFISLLFTTAKPSLESQIKSFSQAYIAGIGPGGTFNKVELEDKLRSDLGDRSIKILRVFFDRNESKTGIISLADDEVFRAPLQDIKNA